MEKRADNRRMVEVKKPYTSTSVVAIDMLEAIATVSDGFISTTIKTSSYLVAERVLWKDSLSLSQTRIKTIRLCAAMPLLVEKLINLLLENLINAN